MTDQHEQAPRKEEWEYWRRIQEEVRLSRQACERLRNQGNAEETRADIAAAIHRELMQIEGLLQRYERQSTDPELWSRLEESVTTLRTLVQRAEDSAQGKRE